MPQLIRYLKTETFGSMTFILLLTHRSFGHSVTRADLSLVGFGCSPSEDFLGCTRDIMHVFIIKNLMVSRISSALRRHRWV